MNSFNLTLSEKHFIFPSILNDSFAGYSNLGCRSLFFMTLTTSSQSLLACKVSFEKTVDSLMGTTLQVNLSFPLAVLSLFIFNLWHSNYDVSWCGSLWVQLVWDSCASCTCMSISFTTSGKFSFIIFSNKFSISCSSSSPSGTLIYDLDVGTFRDVLEAPYPILVF